MVIWVIGGYGGIVVVVVIVTAVAAGALVIYSNLFNCLFGGVSCDVGSGSGFNIGCGHSSLALNHHYYHYGHHHQSHHHHNQLHHQLHHIVNNKL